MLSNVPLKNILHDKSLSLILVQDTDIIVTYTDAVGDIQTSTIKAKDLSDSWVWEDPDDENHKQIKKNEVY